MLDRGEVPGALGVKSWATGGALRGMRQWLNLPNGTEVFQYFNTWLHSNSTFGELSSVYPPPLFYHTGFILVAGTCYTPSSQRILFLPQLLLILQVPIQDSLPQGSPPFSPLGPPVSLVILQWNNVGFLLASFLILCVFLVLPNILFPAGSGGA